MFDISKCGVTDLTRRTAMKFNVFCRRYNINVCYNIERTEKGWYISHRAINGECEKNGEAILFANLRQDFIKYPAGLGDVMAYLWDTARRLSLSDEAIQSELNKIADWISATERSVPEGGIFTEYFGK